MHKSWVRDLGGTVKQMGILKKTELLKTNITIQINNSYDRLNSRLGSGRLKYGRWFKGNPECKYRKNDRKHETGVKKYKIQNEKGLCISAKSVYMKRERWENIKWDNGWTSWRVEERHEFLDKKHNRSSTHDEMTECKSQKAHSKHYWKEKFLQKEKQRNWHKIFHQQ